MSGPILDFLIWLGEAWTALAPPRPPRRALGLQGGAPTLFAFDGAAYRPERPAAPGDSAPLLLGEGEALAFSLSVPAAAALHGAGAARLEAGKRCPFPLAEADWALARAPRAWGEAGAPWRFAAARRDRTAAARQALAALGAKPGPAFALADGAALALPARRPRLLPALGVAAVLALAGAALSAEFAAGRIEAAAAARLDAARAALDAAEAEASSAAAAREAASAPLRAASAAAAALSAAPPAAAALAALSAATPDEAHALRLTIRPERIEGEFVAPDAAALAASLGAAPGFSAARLRTAARAAPGGLQRAALELTPARPE